MPAKKLITPGTRYSRWEVIQESAPRFTSAGIAMRQMLCRCDCGTVKIVNWRSLTSGISRSCGCLRVEITKARVTTHGHSRLGYKTRTYEIWCGMIGRCNNAKHRQFCDYGGRGIKICERWLEYPNFLADMGEIPAGMSIDRINNDANYEPSNCRLATPSQQSRNTRRNHLVEFRGRTMPLVEACELAGVHYERVRMRLKAGWTLESAINKPIRKGAYTNRKMQLPMNLT